MSFDRLRNSNSCRDAPWRYPSSVLERDGWLGAQRYVLRNLGGPLAFVVLAIGVGVYAAVYSLTAQLLMRAIER